MSSTRTENTPDGAEEGTPASKPPSRWRQAYGEKHRFHRITEFPPGLAAPRRVRLYRRSDHYLLQWWSPSQGKNVSERIGGDLLTALVRAREIEQRLTDFPQAAASAGRCAHIDLVEGFLDDLRQRAEAGEIQPGTVERYRSALAFYLDFATQDAVQQSYRHAHQIDRHFQVAFAAFLTSRQVAPNGRSQGGQRPMKSQAFVMDTVRALLEWASDPDRGHLLPVGFRNPFRRPAARRFSLAHDPLKEPDITVNMALDFFNSCDRYQLLLFVPLLFFGLRASEPCFLFREYLEDLWLRVPCNPDLAYRTKGRRDKRFPLIESLQSFWNLLRAGPGQGLLYNRRSVYEGKELAPLQGRSLAELVLVFQQQVREAKSLDAAGRLRLRGQVLHEAGGMTYDDVQGEFEGLARRLGWSKEATLKDFRHLFCTTLENAAMPEAYRRYLMGHAPGKAAIMAYTHLNQLRQRYAEAIQREWQPLVEAVNQRLRQIQDS